MFETKSKTVTSWYKAVKDFVLKRPAFLATVNSFANLCKQFLTLLTICCAWHGKTW